MTPPEDSDRTGTPEEKKPERGARARAQRDQPPGEQVGLAAPEGEGDDVEGVTPEPRSENPVDPEQPEAVEDDGSTDDEPLPDGHYTREGLREGARALLGVSPHAVAGALATVNPDTQTFTIDEARALVDEFLSRPVDPSEEAV